MFAYIANAVALMTVDSVDKNSKRHKMFETVLQVLSEQNFVSPKEIFISTSSDKCTSENWSNLKANIHHIETVRYTVAVDMEHWTDL